MRSIVTVIVFFAALLSQAPAAWCSGQEEALPALAADAPGSGAQGLFALQPAPSRHHKAKGMASPFTHSFSALYTGSWGTASNRTDFREGMSRLDWPMNFELVGGAYKVRYLDVVEWDISIQGCPWTRSSKDMKDYDALTDSYYFLPPHSGIDVYSRSTTDSKAFFVDTELRVFPLSFRYGALGLLAGYQSQDMDFKTYDLHQTGYGPWDAQYTGNLSGPNMTYSLDYDIYSLGLSWRLKAGEQASLTVDTAYIPYAKATDQDNHLLRNRASESDCNGTGYMLSLNGQFFLTKRWFVSSSCSKIHISTDGHQSQYWYGDDPITGQDDTGGRAEGIDSEMSQDSFRIGLGIGCRI